MSLRWLCAFALCVACQRATPTAKQGPSASVAAVVGSAPPSANDERVPSLVQAPEPPLSLGPAAAGATPADREQRLKDLLSGQTPADRLPLHKTNAEAPYDSRLYTDLTSEVVTGGLANNERVLAAMAKVRVAPPSVVSGPLEPGPATRVTAGMRAGFRSCYGRAWPEVDRAPRHFSFRVVLEINADGSVASSRVEGAPQRPNFASFFECLKLRAEASEFQAADKPSELRFSVDVQGPAPGAF